MLAVVEGGDGEGREEDYMTTYYIEASGTTGAQIIKLLAIASDMMRGGRRIR